MQNEHGRQAAPGHCFLLPQAVNDRQFQLAFERQASRWILPYVIGWELDEGDFRFGAIEKILLDCGQGGRDEKS